MTSLIIEARRNIRFLSILGDDIFRTLERIESKQPYYTTLVLGYTESQDAINYYQILAEKYQSAFNTPATSNSGIT